jgi:hypothetical protein
VDAAAQEALTLRAVELAVQGRSDRRLLVASTPGLPGPKKTARFIAGLANAAFDRSSVLLLGVAGRQVHGLGEEPDSEYWDRVLSAFPAEVPAYEPTLVEIGTATIAAVHVTATNDLIIATRRGTPIVPWFDNGRLGQAYAERFRPLHRAANQLPSIRVDGVWIERSAAASESGVIVYRGAIDVTLAATPGTLADDAASVTLLIPGLPSPVTMDAQIHPLSSGTGVVRGQRGIEVFTDFAARVYVAAAQREAPGDPSPTPVQLALTALLPGRVVSELRSVVLSPDGSNRWVL